MTYRTAGLLVLGCLVATAPIRAQRDRHPDLQGTWIGSSLTPLQRPAEFKDKASFTPEEAAEYTRTASDRFRSRLPTEADRLTQADVDEAFVETEVIKLDGLRTSLLIDPPNGVLPPPLPAAQARIAARPKRLYEDPETFNLAERCLLGNFGVGGSAASPPLIPSVVAAYYYAIVQTDDYVMIAAEWMHDARIIRMNGAHPPSTIRKWLGDSIGRWEGSTLVVDTTNFRPEVHNLDSGEHLHVVERFTKVSDDVLRYRVTVDDPDTWATSWTAEWPFKATDSKIYETACHEGNLSIENFLRGARAEEKRQPAPPR
jgi:hypothetical protein